MKDQINHTLSAKRLLVFGAVMAPLFYGVFIVQMLMREGFNIAKHPISALALGDFGWIQSINFIVAGALALMLAVGLRQVLKAGKGGVWGPLLTAIFGLGIILAGLFATDPAFGFPLGTPDTRPTTMTSHAAVHSIGFYTAFTALIAACFVLARRFSSVKDDAWARLSSSVGVATLALIVLGMTVFSGLAGLCFAVAGLLSMGWLSATAWHLRK